MLIKTWAAPIWRICVRRRDATGTNLAAPCTEPGSVELRRPGISPIPVLAPGERRPGAATPTAGVS